MAYSKPAKQIIRLALIRAIDEREAMIDAYSGIDNAQDKVYVETVQEEVNDYRQMLKRRYNEV